MYPEVSNRSFEETMLSRLGPTCWSYVSHKRHFLTEKNSFVNSSSSDSSSESQSRVEVSPRKQEESLSKSISIHPSAADTLATPSCSELKKKSKSKVALLLWKESGPAPEE